MLIANMFVDCFCFEDLTNIVENELCFYFRDSTTNILPMLKD